jgi:hypothetical protein
MNQFVIFRQDFRVLFASGLRRSHHGEGFYPQIAQIGYRP